jgi:hypothetical protein
VKLRLWAVIGQGPLSSPGRLDSECCINTTAGRNVTLTGHQV